METLSKILNWAAGLLILPSAALALPGFVFAIIAEPKTRMEYYLFILPFALFNLLAPALLLAGLIIAKKLSNKGYYKTAVLIQILPVIIELIIFIFLLK